MARQKRRWGYDSRGTPLAVSRLGGLVDIIQSGVTGLHFEPSDASAMVDAVRRLWSDPDLRERIRVAGRREYEERYTPERNLEQMLELYAHVLRRAAGADRLARAS